MDIGNYYIVLGLEPSATIHEIEKKIKEKEKEWNSNISTGIGVLARTTATYYKSKLPEIKSALADPQKRAEIAKKANDIYSAENKKKDAFFENAIKLLRLSCFKAPANSVKKLANLTGRVENDIESRLKKEGIFLDSESAQGQVKKAIPPQTLKEISEWLVFFNKGSLYDFISEIKPDPPKGARFRINSSLSDLQQRVKELSNHWTSQITTEKDLNWPLITHAILCFKDKAHKDCYDDSISLDFLRVLLELCGNVIEQEQLNFFLKLAKEKNVNESRVKEFIKNSKKLILEKKGPISSCNCCGTLLSPGQKYCNSCKAPLLGECFRCGKKFSSDSRICSDCGCTDVDTAFITELFNEAKRERTKNRPEDSEKILDRILYYWKDWKPAVEEKKQLVELKKEKESYLREIRNKIKDCCYSEAKEKIRQCEVKFGSDVIDSADKKSVEKGLRTESDFADLVKDARRALNLKEISKASQLMVKAKALFPKRRECIELEEEIQRKEKAINDLYDQITAEKKKHLFFSAKERLSDFRAISPDDKRLKELENDIDCYIKLSNDWLKKLNAYDENEIISVFRSSLCACCDNNVALEHLNNKINLYVERKNYSSASRLLLATKVYLKNTDHRNLHERIESEQQKLQVELEQIKKFHDKKCFFAAKIKQEELKGNFKYEKAQEFDILCKITEKGIAESESFYNKINSAGDEKDQINCYSSSLSLCRDNSVVLYSLNARIQMYMGQKKYSSALNLITATESYLDPSFCSGIKAEINEHSVWVKQKIERIEKLCNDRMFYTAEKELDELKKRSPFYTELSIWENRVSSGQKNANSYIKKADSLIDENEKIRNYLLSLEQCSDSPLVENFFKNLAPPPPPVNVSISISGFRVLLKWQEPTSAGIKSYIIVRKEGGRPQNINDGAVFRCDKNSFEDLAATESGHVFYYSIFSLRQAVVEKASLHPAFAEKVVTMSEVEGCQTFISDSNVRIGWRNPKGVKRIEIWKRPGGEPLSEIDSEVISVTSSSDEFIDAKLENGRPYGYKIFTVFEQGSGEVRSKGISFELTPRPKPNSIEIQERSLNNNTLSLKWTKTSPGKVLFFISKKDNFDNTNYSSGKLFELDKLPLLKEDIRFEECDNAGKAEMEISDFQGLVHVLPVSVCENMAVMGECFSVENITPISDLRISRSQASSDIELNWEWPIGVDEVLIRYDNAVYPSIPTEKDIQCVKVYRSNMSQKSGNYTLRKTLASESYFFSVFSVGKSSKGFIYSSCKEGMVTKTDKYEIDYKVENGFPWQKNRKITVSCSDKGNIALPAMTFVGTVGVHPKNIKDGIVLLELPAGSRYGSYEITAEIEPDDIDRGFYVRGFFVSSDDCANFSINYPAEDKMKFKKKFF